MRLRWARYLLDAGDMLRDRQEIVTRKMSAEELRTGVGRSECDDDDRRTREMVALERDELLRIEARERLANVPHRIPTARTQRLQRSMLARLRPELRIAALASAIAVAFIVGVLLR